MKAPLWLRLWLWQWQKTRYKISPLDYFFRQSKFQILPFNWLLGQPFKKRLLFLNYDLKHKASSTSLMAPLWEIWSIFSPNPASEKRKWKQFEQKDDIMMIWDSFFFHILWGWETTLLLSKSWQKKIHSLFFIFFPAI